MPKYAIGIDFGTLSARALVAEIGTGRELASAEMRYAHGVMDEALPCGKRLEPDWALQHPRDYLDCLSAVVKEAVERSGVRPGDVVGLGVDFTSSTVMPLDKEGTPLCLLPEFACHPHAYAKLWKHHAAQDQARRMDAVAKQRGEGFLAGYGNTVSSEWMFPKLWQVFEEAPEVYHSARSFMEAGDFIVMQLTGREARSAAIAGYKAFWKNGYPSPEFFGALHPGFARIAEEKLGHGLLPIGQRAGGLTEDWAEKTGLLPGTAVAVCNVDAHVSLPAAGISRPGTLLMILGTSNCHILLGEEERVVPGICGAVRDGAVPGYLGYEAGQTCGGDHFHWFVKNCVPAAYEREAREQGLDLHELLTRKAAQLKAGESGLLALDWWNGNRSVLVDADLSGMILGMTLLTRPEEMYRALIEATAYGTRMIVENFADHGVEIREICAGGGIAHKNPFLVQVYADVLGRTIRVARSSQAPALGSAMFGAVAAGRAAGGYDSIHDAAREMGGVGEVYHPNAEGRRVYEALYREYVKLHDLFGRKGNPVMKALKSIRQQNKSVK